MLLGNEGKDLKQLSLELRVELPLLQVIGQGELHSLDVEHQEVEFFLETVSFRVQVQELVELENFDQKTHIEMVVCETLHEALFTKPKQLELRLEKTLLLHIARLDSPIVLLVQDLEDILQDVLIHSVLKELFAFRGTEEEEDSLENNALVYRLVDVPVFLGELREEETNQEVFEVDFAFPVFLEDDVLDSKLEVLILLDETICLVD